MRRCALVLAVAAAAFALPALGSSTANVDVLGTVGKQLAAVKRKTALAVLLPGNLPFGGRVPRVYVSSYGTRDTWGFELDGAPNCGGADACFLVSFQAKRGARLPVKPNLKLARGWPAVYKGITCGGSCSPATLWFTHRGVLYVWQQKDPPKNAKSVLARLAAQAIAAGPR